MKARLRAGVRSQLETVLAADVAALLPLDLVEPFTTSDLAAAIAKPR